jgi:hypothetical protein
MRVKGLRQTKVSQYGASVSCFQRSRERRTARCSFGAGVEQVRDERDEQDAEEDEPASVRDGKDAVEAGERGREDEEARESLERRAAEREPRTD